MKEDEKRDSIRYALRDAVEKHIDESKHSGRTPVPLRSIPNEHVLDHFLESLENRGLSVDKSAPRHYCSNGEAGDGQMVCAGCGKESDEVHAWSDCVAFLNKEVVAAVDYCTELQNERDQARAHAESLRKELDELRKATKDP